MLKEFREFALRGNVVDLAVGVIIGAAFGKIVESLVDAKRCLRAAWEVLDGTDGAASGVEHALGAALSGIDAIYAIEHVHAFNQDVASPADVQEFWEEHGALPGFAAGT